MSNYEYKIKKQIRSGYSHDHRWVERVVSTPFPPYEGLQLTCDDWEETLAEVYYHLLDKVFVCYTEPDREIYEAKWGHRDIERTVAKYVARGWVEK
jgi:hypothetical protein